MVQKKRLDSSTNKTNRLEELRGTMPVQEASARVGCKYPIWYRWESGSTLPTLPYIPRIESLLSSIQGRAITYRDIWPNIDMGTDGLE